MDNLPKLMKHRNPVAAAPILRKGGVHQKSQSAQRTQARTQLRREIRQWQPAR